MESSHKNKTVGVIDFFRGIAILMVLCYHTQLAVFPDFESNRSFWNITPFAMGGNGVILFFIISGFVIHYGHLKSNTKLNNTLFFNKRFWRIVPPYYLALAFFAFCVLQDYSSKDIWYHFLFIHNLDKATFFTINPSFWSIAIEVQFYLLYPLFLFLIKMIGTSKFIIFLLFITLTVIFYCIFQRFDVSVILTKSVMYYWLVWCLGAYLAEKYINHKTLFKLNFKYIILMSILIYLLKIIILCINSKEIKSTYQIVNQFIFALYFLVLIDYFLNLNVVDIKIFKALTNSFIIRKIYDLISFVGLISYSIYLLHQPLLDILLKCTSFGKLTQFWGGFKVFDISLVLILILFISYSYYNLIELFFIKQGKLFYNKFKKSN